ncbi:GNAT family N-acetyltransferase [Sedimentitalea todarodis]|uniref:GNAT family N-acetyltransferase n=1 Tax=Sedimentitalea todarodis TaxID=1631240 RepID=A0ABU3VC89_9RHOB|nr:GNAT family N-acetyltransferase [Sedimentitalea todarodis]MDU9003803.1 GNAT family N-acetyltransferase [Sedimentitalea todarodis]
MLDSIPSATHRPCPLQQHPNFGAALRACGQDPLVLPPPDPVVILRRRLGGRLPVAMLARSDLAALPSEDGALRDWLRRTGLERAPILLSPDSPCAERLADLGAVPVMTPASVAEIDLTLPEEHRRARLHQKWRNRLTQAETRSRLRVSLSTRAPARGHWLFTADRALQKRRGYRNWPEALTLAYGQENPKQTVLLTAYSGRDPVAAMLFLRHSRAVTYHIGHSTPAGRKLSAHTLLLWQAACWCAAQGHQRLDLGLIDTQNAAGLARFKLGSGADARKLGGTWLWWPPLGRTLRGLSALDRRSMKSLPH